MILYPVKMAFKFWSIKSKVDDRSLFRNFVYALNSNKTHTFILLTLYHLVGPIYTQRMEEGKWNDPVKNFAVLKKINYSLLAWWTLNIYAHRSACLHTFAQENSLFYFVPQFVMHWSVMNAYLLKLTFLTGISQNFGKPYYDYS